MRTQGIRWTDRAKFIAAVTLTASGFVLFCLLAQLLAAGSHR